MRWVLVVSLVLVAAAATSQAVTLLEQDRGTFARAEASEAGSYDAESTADEAPGFADFASGGPATAATSLAQADADATLATTIGATLLRADGTATSMATTSAGDGRAEAPADAFHELVFEADASEPFRLLGRLATSAQGGDAFASVELVDVDADTVLVLQQAGPDALVPFNETGNLVAGRTYRLTAVALSRALADPLPTSDAADAEFETRLVLPEPDARAILVLGAIFALALRSLRGSTP